jgi:hypothetical protein
MPEANARRTRGNDSEIILNYRVVSARNICSMLYPVQKIEVQPTMMLRNNAGCFSVRSQVVSLLILVRIGTCQSDPSRVYGYRFFDELRLRSPSELVLSNENSVYHVTVTKSDTTTTPVLNTTDTFRLVEIKTFLPFSTSGVSLRPGASDEAFTALLAMQHWNKRQNQQLLSASRGQEEIKSSDSDSESDSDGPCNVRMTMELLDTQLSPFVATRTFTSLLQKESISFQDPPVAAVVGAYRYVRCMYIMWCIG